MPGYETSPFDFGAAGDNITDDTNAVLAAIATGKSVQGWDSWFAVSGDIPLPGADFRMRNCFFRQLAPNAPNRRTLWRPVNAGIGELLLENVKVDRNGTGAMGSVSSPAAAIAIQCGIGVRIKDCEVYGASAGHGIWGVNLNDYEVSGCRVHDLRWDLPTDPGSEQVVGIYTLNSTDVSVRDNVVENLMGIVNGALYGTVQDNYQAEGIDFGNCTRVVLAGNVIRKTWGGIDISGSGQNTRFAIAGNVIEDVYSWGLKLAHLVQDAEVVGNIVRNAGLGGHTAGLDAGARNIAFTACQSINTGSNGLWSAMNTAGFSLMGPSPECIDFTACKAMDYSGSMRYGFRSDITGSPLKPPRVISSWSRGHTVSATTGSWASTEVF